MLVGSGYQKKICTQCVKMAVELNTKIIHCNKISKCKNNYLVKNVTVVELGKLWCRHVERMDKEV